MSKVTVVGAGFVGETVAITLVRNESVDEVVLVDIIEDMPAGKGLDMRESTPINGSDTKIWGSNDYSQMEGSDIVVVTAGIPRKPGMDRMDLLKTNINICKSVVENIVKYAPNSIIIYVANPVDVLTYAAKEISGFPAIPNTLCAGKPLISLPMQLRKSVVFQHTEFLVWLEC